MTRILYDLAGSDEAIRFSPYCWRTKMALKHKGLDFETRVWRFTEKDAIARSGQERVPVLVDGGTWVADSWKIANHLDDTYPQCPPLMPGDQGRAVAHFFNGWADIVLNATIRPLSIMGVMKLLGDEDAAHFRRTREEMLGWSLEAVCADQDAARAGFRTALAPVEQHLGQSDFMTGGDAAYADYIVFGSLQWLAVARGTPCLETLPATSAWFARLGDLFGGFAKSAPRTPHAAA